MHQLPFYSGRILVAAAFFEANFLTPSWKLVEI